MARSRLNTMALKRCVLITVMIMTIATVFLLNKITDKVHMTQTQSMTERSLQSSPINSEPAPRGIFLDTTTNASTSAFEVPMSSQYLVRKSNRSTGNLLDTKEAQQLHRAQLSLMDKSRIRDNFATKVMAKESDETVLFTVDNLGSDHTSTLPEKTHSTQTPVDNVYVSNNREENSTIRLVSHISTNLNDISNIPNSPTTIETNDNDIVIQEPVEETMLLNNSNITSKKIINLEFSTRLKSNATTNSFNKSFTDLLPRSVYFDSRPRDGHDNATVILVQVLKTVFEEQRVTGCGVDDHITKDFLFNKPLAVFTPFVHKQFPSLTHDQAMLTCYDLPVHQGSRAFVFYKDNKTDGVLRLEAEKRLYIPAERREVPTNRWNSSILVCTTLYGTPPWLREWLVYQKTIGVDFIHLYAQESFIAEGGANNSVLQSYLKSGYAKLDVWKAYLNESQDFYHQQPLLYVDCIYRYRTEFDYALLYDTDDFFVPLIPGETNIHYYANRLFRNEKIACVNFNWTQYFPDCGLTTRPKDIKDGNITQHLAFNSHHKVYLKSMYRFSGIVEVQIHDAVKFMPGYMGYNTENEVPIAYVAHIRKNLKPKDAYLRDQCEKYQREHYNNII